MRCLARELSALEHLICAQPVAVGADDYEVACSQDEQVVMCPAWAVGGILGPGRHRWRSPEPQFPATAYFVRTAPVHVAFAMTTAFALPSDGHVVHLRANGSLHAQCSDVGLLIAQLVGLPSDSLNDEVLRSVSRSVERQLARLLARRVIVDGVSSVTDPSAWSPLVAELSTHNLVAGAVLGIDVVRIEELAVAVDSAEAQLSARAPVAFDARTEKLLISPVTSEQGLSAQGEIVVKTPAPTEPITSPGIGPVEMPDSSILAVGNSYIGASAPEPVVSPTKDEPAPRTHPVEEVNHNSRGLSPGTRVLVASSTGLMQSATVRRMQRGHYELEVGGTGETIWVPVSGVVPE